MTASTTNYTPEHQPDASRFIIHHPLGDIVLAYRVQGTSVDFYSTYVPPALRGQGLAERIVRTGLAWAKKQGLAIHASCWYVAKFIC